jgi:hypothetical protein
MKDQVDRDKLRAQIAGYMTDLQTKFGPDVYVVEADIYDPSDGAGDFAKAGCGGTLALLPMMPTDTFFANWNAVVNDEVPKLDHGVVSPLHEAFKGHGISAGANRWFLGDCIHPTKDGHQALRKMFWKTLTGQDGPALVTRRATLVARLEGGRFERNSQSSVTRKRLTARVAVGSPRRHGIGEARGCVGGAPALGRVREGQPGARDHEARSEEVGAAAECGACRACGSKARRRAGQIRREGSVDARARAGDRPRLSERRRTRRGHTLVTGSARRDADVGP